MLYGKIENDKCVNIMDFHTHEKAIEFDETLVLVEEGYGIGDECLNGVWKHLPDHRINQIHQELKELDLIVNRATEDTIEELHNQFGYVPYETTVDVINHKEDLREELKRLSEVENDN